MPMEEWYCLVNAPVAFAVRNESVGSGKVKLIDAFKDNLYQKNNVLDRCFNILTDCIECSRLGSEVYPGPSRMHVLQKD
jgi:hypothetical protein